MQAKINATRFIKILTLHYTDLFETDPGCYAMAAARYNPRALAEKMTEGFITGTTNKDGTGIRRTCKELGIKHTYTAIEAFLKGQSNAS